MLMHVLECTRKRKKRQVRHRERGERRERDIVGVITTWICGAFVHNTLKRLPTTEDTVLLRHSGISYQLPAHRDRQDGVHKKNGHVGGSCGSFLGFGYVCLSLLMRIMRAVQHGGSPRFFVVCVQAFM